MRVQGLVFGVVLCLAWPGALVQSAPTASLARAEALYTRGAMHEAAALAREVDGAAGLTLAAKATLVEALYLASPDDRPRLLREAIADGRKALALDPASVDARLQLAMALGAFADWEGPVAAHLSGHAREGRALLMQARRLAPDDPWPEGLLGIWHLQLVRHGSAALAAELYGASEATGLALCRAAARRAPEAIALRYGCAISMLQLDPRRLGAEARRELEALLALPAPDAATALVQADARRRLAALMPDGPG